MTYTADRLCAAEVHVLAAALRYHDAATSLTSDIEKTKAETLLRRAAAEYRAAVDEEAER